MRLEVAGVRVGHWTDEVARTGCTVVVFPDGTTASGEVRGGAPATREVALLDPVRTIDRIDALVLSGGSAFGLGACDGVMRWCDEQGMGFVTGGGSVPIVVGLSLYDLLEGDGSVRPGPDEGYLAASRAGDEVATGRVGAGTGATVSKWRGREHARPGGLGAAVMGSGPLRVAALVAVNAGGDIDDGTSTAEVRRGDFDLPPIEPFGNTTIGLVVTNARLTKIECHQLAGVGHDGYARALVPAHTAGDGDAVVAAATGAVDAHLGVVSMLALTAVDDAIRSVGAARTEGERP